MTFVLWTNFMLRDRGVNACLAQCLNSVLNVKAVVAAFNQEKALVGAFSVITNLWMELFEALIADKCWTSGPVLGSGGDEKGGSGEHVVAAQCHFSPLT